LAPAFAGALTFYKKIFPAFGGTSLFFIIILFDPQKINYVTDRSLVTPKKNFQVFFQKKFVKIFHMFFLCHFFDKTLAPAFAGALPFL